MTQATVQVEKTITEEETFNICNYCNREVDANGKEFADDDIALHFCSECLSQMSGQDFEQPYVLKTEEWLTQTDEKGDTIYDSINYSFTFSFLAVCVAISGIIITILSFTAPISKTVYGLIIVVCFLVQFGVCLLSLSMLDHAKDVAEDVLDM